MTNKAIETFLSFQVDSHKNKTLILETKYLNQSEQLTRTFAEPFLKEHSINCYKIGVGLSGHVILETKD